MVERQKNTIYEIKKSEANINFQKSLTYANKRGVSSLLLIRLMVNNIAQVGFEKQDHEILTSTILLDRLLVYTLHCYTSWRFQDEMFFYNLEKTCQSHQQFECPHVIWPLEVI